MKIKTTTLLTHWLAVSDILNESNLKVVQASGCPKVSDTAFDCCPKIKTRPKCNVNALW